MSTSLVGAIGQAAVRKITYRSQITPQAEWRPGAPPAAQPGFGAWFLSSVVKPSVTVHTAAGPVTYAPYGAPTSNYWPLIAGGMIFSGVTLLWLATRGLRRRG